MGDVKVDELNVLPDPCPMPSREKKRNLLEKERSLYAPMSGVGGIVYDKDAVYIELQGSHSHRKNENSEQSKLVNAFIEKKQTFDEQVNNQEFKLFSDGDVIKSSDFREEEFQENSDSDGEENDSGLEDQNNSDIEQDNEDLGGWQEESDQENPEENDNSSDEEYQEFPTGKTSRTSGILSDGDDENPNVAWKEGLADKAREAYLERQANTQNLMKLVYGKFSLKNKKSANNIDEADNESDEETIGGLFKSIGKQQSELQKERQMRDDFESSFFDSYGGVRDWLSDENKKLMKNCFVTGKWKSTEDAEKLLELDDMSDADSEVFGDFEDLETGEKFEGKKNKSGEKTQEEEKTETADDNSKKRKFSRIEEANMSRSELMAKKIKLKAKFDAEYDNPEEKKKDAHRVTGDDAFYEALKAEAERQAELNRKEFANLDDDTRLDIEGFRAGLYVRINFKNIPCEFVENFDPTYPILIGALNMAEENVGFVSCKVKKHRWYKKILKTGDPLIVSMGWRRFQTIPIYAKIEDDLKHRYLKYTPNHVTCNMTFYGPITPQNTGILAVQSVSNDNAEVKRLGFRIAATGAVNEIDKSSHILKKLKLVGTPCKIFKKSAFVSGETLLHF